MTTELLGLFPTPILQTSLDRDFTDAELTAFFQHKDCVKKNQNNYTSRSTRVLDYDTLSPIKKFIQNTLRFYLFKVYQPVDNLDISITQSWVNFSGPDNFHHRHYHANSFLSGVLYINVNPESDRIIFHNPVKHVWDLNPQENNAFNSSQWFFENFNRQLLIFPSSLEHSTQVVTGQQTRISLSFNSMLDGKIGSQETLTELSINSREDC